MKHFSDDGCNPIPPYDYSIFHRNDEDNTNKDYDKPIGGLHIEDWEKEDDWDSGTIKHFQD